MSAPFRPLRKVLVANRGEIAVRLLHACRELGIVGVAVYTEIDRRARHVRLADAAIPLGPDPAAYLDPTALLAAAAQAGADALHPGYGFLSERADFAAAVQAAGLTWIGPPPAAMRALGDKAAARAAAAALGVPTPPGYAGPDDDAALLAAAAEVGFPLLVKAAAGGGGKGMRRVDTPTELPAALAAARREALHAFGDGRLLLERYLTAARHIEIQLLADQHGRVLHLFERDCSVQRRHQKILEEAPAPDLPQTVRDQMGAAAVAIAAAAGYTNAGTIEFIYEPASGAFYFLEMNARLQVEHPVTEALTGLDLAQWQLRIAAGEPLPFTQTDLSARGHAIEVRLYAEDPARQFLPASGPLLAWRAPHGPGVRVDTGYTTGDEITRFYDPLIAKIIVAAADRPAALARLRAALSETVVLGLTTNLRFLQDLIAMPEFAAGPVSTTWVEERFAAWEPDPCDLPPEVLIAAALAQFAAAPPPAEAASAADPYSPWRASSGFRLGA